MPKRLLLGKHRVTLNSAQLLSVVCDAALLERTADGYRFTHELLQEYFAAVYLNALGTEDPKVLECLHYNAWDETVVLLGGLMHHRDRLVEYLRALDPF